MVLMVDYEALYMTGKDIKNAFSDAAFLLKELPGKLMKPLKTYVDYSGIIGRSSKNKNDAVSSGAGGCLEGAAYGIPLSFVLATHTTYTLSTGTTIPTLEINTTPILVLMLALGLARGIHGLYEFNKAHKPITP